MVLETATGLPDLEIISKVVNLIRLDLELFIGQQHAEVEQPVDIPIC